MGLALRALAAVLLSYVTKIVYNILHYFGVSFGFGAVLLWLG